MRLVDQWSRFDHQQLSYDSKRKDCILLLDAAARTKVNEELTVSADALQWRCRWLGQPPAQPLLPPGP